MNVVLQANKCHKAKGVSGKDVLLLWLYAWGKQGSGVFNAADSAPNLFCSPAGNQAN